MKFSLLLFAVSLTLIGCDTSNKASGPSFSVVKSMPINSTYALNEGRCTPATGWLTFRDGAVRLKQAGASTIKSLGKPRIEKSEGGEYVRITADVMPTKAQVSDKVDPVLRVVWVLTLKDITDNGFSLAKGQFTVHHQSGAKVATNVPELKEAANTYHKCSMKIL